MRFTDSVTRSFLEYGSPSWRYAVGGGTVPNKFLEHQDPTYIGFYVRFYGLGIEGSGQKETGVPDYDRWPGGLFFDESHPDSAIRYLKNIGEYGRAQMLREFREGIYQLQKMPWYLKKVSGLDDIWKIKPSESYRGKEKKISFDTLESIDLKMTYLLDLYRKATFDSVYMRWILPENLRVFEMDLIITEIRTMQRPADLITPTNDPETAEDLRSVQNPIEPPPLGSVNIGALTESAIQGAANAIVPNSQWASGLSNALLSTLNRDPGSYSNYPVLMKEFNDLATFVVFEFSHCEFAPFEDAPPFFGTLSKSPEKEAENKFTIFTPVIREVSTYGLLGAILRDTPGLVGRAIDDANEDFFKKKNDIQKTAPDTEKGYLAGVKNEEYLVDGVTGINSQQSQNQRRLREENIRNNGILGNLIGNAVAIGASQLNNAIQGAIAGLVLGNVFSDTFPIPISQALAQKVQLESPPFIENLITSIALDSAGSSLNDGVGADTVLDAPPVQTEADETTVVLFAPSTEGAPPGEVSFTAPPVSNISSPLVPLEGPDVSGLGSPTVNLTAFPINPISDPEVALDAPLVNPSPDTAVTLDGPVLGPPSASKTDLTAPPANPLTGTKVFLEAPDLLQIPPGETALVGPDKEEASSSSVELTAPPDLAASDSKVELVESPQLGAPPTSTILEGPVVDSNPPGSTTFVAPAVPAAQPIKEELVDNGAQLVGPAGSTILTSPPIPEAAPGNTPLTGAEIEAGAPGQTQLTSPPPVQNAGGSVILEGAPKRDAALPPVQLEEPTIAAGDPGEVQLLDQNNSTQAQIIGNGPEIGTTPLDAPAVYDKILGGTTLEGARPRDEFMGDVELVSAPIPPGAGGKIDFGNDPDILGRELPDATLEAPAIKEVTPGTTLFEEATPSTAPPGNASLEGPEIIENPPKQKASLEGPTIANSNPGKITLDEPTVSKNAQLSPVKLDSAPPSPGAAGGTVLLESPEVKNVDIPAVGFEAPLVSKRDPGEVPLYDSNNSSDPPQVGNVPDIGVVRLEEPQLSDKILGNINLEGVKSATLLLGSASLEEPFVYKPNLGDVDFGKPISSLDRVLPDTKLEGAPIGNRNPMTIGKVLGESGTGGPDKNTSGVDKGVIGKANLKSTSINSDLSGQFSSQEAPLVKPNQDLGNADLG